MKTLMRRGAVFLVLLTALFALCTPSLTAQDMPTTAQLPDAPRQTLDTTMQRRASREGPPDPTDVTVEGTPKRMLFDEAAILTSPRKFRVGDLRWVVPLAATSGLLIGTDPHTMTLLHVNANDQNRAVKLSNGTLGLLGALPAGMFLWSAASYSPLARESSLLTAESLGDAMILSEALRAITLRNRPLVGNKQGNFFSSNFTDAGFPSNHATAAWAMASVIGDEYRGWLPRALVYTLAATTSVDRVIAEKHFPSDVVVGSALGWLVGHYVYRAHHHYDLTPYLDPPDWREDTRVASTSTTTNAQYAAPTVAAAPVTPPLAPTAPSQTTANPAAKPIPSSSAAAPSSPARNPPAREIENIGDSDPDTIGSPNVPMDRWVYPALERLAAMGFIPSQSIAIRPWTRVECERQLAEASDLVAGIGPDEEDSFSKSEATEAARLLDSLEREFDTRENANESLVLDSIYARYGTIAGPALADGLHLGQTWWNDFGRPLGRGGSALVGFSVHANEGRMFLYARAESQHGPATPAYSAPVEQLFAELDSNPVHASMAAPSYTRYRPIEMYAGIAFDGNALSFGKQELFWGPTTMGPLMFSSNAEPTYSLRFVANRPHPLPFFPNLGTYRFDIVMGKLSGHGYEDGGLPNLTNPARPWYNAQKADFKIGQNLEFSFTRWSIFWGVGHPITLHSLLRNLYNFSSADNGVVNESTVRAYPGAYDSGFDFRYRLPWLRKLVTLYADGYANDDPNPIDAPRRAMWNPGIYFARLPWLPHMDLRVEAVSSEQLARDLGGDYYYFKHFYHDESTNKGFLLGNAIGRDSRAEEARLGWWISAHTRVEVGYRQSKGGHLSDPTTGALPGGSTITDGFVNARWQVSRSWSAQAFAQYERFLIPDYITGAQTNGSGWLQMTWTPEAAIRK